MHKPAPRAHNKRSNPHHDHVPSDEMDLLISTINEADLGWKADVCKLQKHHEQYGSHCDSEVELAQTDSGKTFGKGDDFQKSLALAQSFQKKYATADEIPDSEIPESFDWRDVGGHDYTGQIRDQKSCGSCYTVAFT